MCDYKHAVLEPRLPSVPMPHLRQVRLLLHLPALSHGLTRCAWSTRRAAARAWIVSAGVKNGVCEALRLYEAC